MSSITLSPRLLSVGRLVPAGCRYADVGTDHAYLPVWLLQNGVVSRAIASDVREGPLARARQTAARYGLTGQISFRLCDGLSGIAPEEVDTVSIAGMGGETIADILSAAPWSGQGDRRWLLQPMSAAEDLRTWLYGHGFHIESEPQAQGGPPLYVTMLPPPAGPPPLSPGELWAGRQWEGMEAPPRGAYLDKLLLRASRARDGARASGRAEDLARARTFDDIYHSLTELKKEWDTWQR